MTYRTLEDFFSRLYFETLIMSLFVDSLECRLIIMLSSEYLRSLSFRSLSVDPSPFLIALISKFNFSKISSYVWSTILAHVLQWTTLGVFMFDQ